MNATKAAAFKLDPIVMIMMGYSPLETRQVENLQVRSYSLHPSSIRSLQDVYLTIHTEKIGQTFREDLGGAAAPEVQYIRPFASNYCTVQYNGLNPITLLTSQWR